MSREVWSRYVLHHRYPSFSDELMNAVKHVLSTSDDRDLVKRQTIIKILRHMDDEAPSAEEITILGDDRFIDEEELKENDLYDDEDLLKIRRLIIEARDLTSALEHLTDEELKREFDDATLREAVDYDRGKPYALEIANADVQHWCKRAWKAEEGVAILLGKDPRYVSRRKLERYEHERSKFIKDFNDLLDVAERAVASGVLKEVTDPAEFLHWARRREIAIPQSIADAVASLSNAKALEGDDIAKLRKQIEDAKKDINNLMEVVSLLSEDDESPKVSFYQILIGMAVINYGFRHPGNSSAAGTIGRELALLDRPNDSDWRDPTTEREPLGLRVGAETVKNRLTEAANALKFSFSARLSLTERSKLKNLAKPNEP